MKMTTRITFMAVFAAFAVTAFGQGAVNSEIKIAKIEPELIKTPDYSFSMGPSGKKTPAKDWLAIDVSFDWQPRNSPVQFIDELTFTYYILLNNKSQEFPQGTLLVGQVTHVAIPIQKGMNSVMYVSPRTLERFFGGKSPSTSRAAIQNVGVTVSRQGQMVAANSLQAADQPWWQNLQQVQGYVLNKSETPFAPLVWDYYEAIKPARSGGM